MLFVHHARERQSTMKTHANQNSRDRESVDRASDLPGPRILVIEDEMPMRMALRDILEGEGYRILSASDGAAGLEMALNEKPDLICSTSCCRTWTALHSARNFGDWPVPSRC